VSGLLARLHIRCVAPRLSVPRLLGASQRSGWLAWVAQLHNHVHERDPAVPKGPVPGTEGRSARRDERARAQTARTR